MSILQSKDLRTVLEPYLDLPATFSLLLTAKVSTYGKKKLNWKKYITTSLKKKRKECKNKWNFHTHSPDHLWEMKKIHKKTKENLHIMELSGDFKWEKQAHVWDVPRYYGKIAHDIMFPGTHPVLGKVQYWRHETKSEQAGQTLLYWDDPKTGRRKRRMVSYILRCIKNGEDFISNMS